MANLTSVGLSAGVPNSGTGTVSTLDGVFNTTGGNQIAIKAASAAPVAVDTALVVSISPNGQNANLNVDPNSGVAGHFGSPVASLDYYSQYKTVAASQTGAVLGATGAQYDYLAGVLIVPATTAAGAVSIADGNGAAISIFAGGGTTALSDLKPFMVPIGAYALASTTPGWKVTTGANVSALGVGRFT